MASLNTTDRLPQEGIHSGKSLPVARPPHADGRAAGCPSYSGGGKETPCASHTRRQMADSRTPTDTPTPTTPAIESRTTGNRQNDVDPGNDKRTIDMTSLSDAMPRSPLAESAWTLVAPRPKRKRTNRRRFQNRRTDAPTAEGGRSTAGGTGGEAPTTANDKVGGLFRQTGADARPSGSRPPAMTVASGQSEGRGGAAQPGTSRHPPADGRKYTSGTKSDNRPAQRRTHPVAPRSNAYWRGRSSGAADEGPGNSGPSNRPSQKRDRLDDTISPRGEPKRRKTDRPTHAEGSYARATQPHLNVAVALVPRANMTQQEADIVQGLIENEIFATCLKQLTPGAAPYAPAFEGRAVLSEGVLKLWCHDEQALSWLQEVVPRLKSPRDGTGLTLIKQTDIPVRVRSCLFVPKYEGEVGKLHLYLTLQNPWYEVSTWTLYTYQRVHGRTPGVFLVLGIPKEQINDILARGRKVAYSTGSIYIRFFTREGTSDVPPKETPKPDTKPDQDKSTPTEDPNPIKDTNIQTDLPPVDSPLSTTSILSSAPSSPSSRQTRWEETTETDMTDTTALTIQELLDTCTDKADN